MAKHLAKRQKKPPLPKSTGQRRLRGAWVGDGFGPITKMREEIQDMTDVLMGRKDPPINDGLLTLMEYADGCFSRAMEMTGNIQAMELDGDVEKNDPLYKFRTGELRTFAELSKRAADLGSRRVTNADLEFKKSSTGRESRGGLT